MSHEAAIRLLNEDPPSVIDGREVAYRFLLLEYAELCKRTALENLEWEVLSESGEWIPAHVAIPPFNSYFVKGRARIKQ